MNRYILRVNVMIVVDTEEISNKVVAENFLARLSELTQSDDHFLNGEIYAMHLPGNKRPMEEVEADPCSS